ncbi:hypothetical protein DsansV1_C09g0091601 [Dioscorea sansibarensis]
MGATIRSDCLGRGLVFIGIGVGVRRSELRRDTKPARASRLVHEYKLAIHQIKTEDVVLVILKKAPMMKIER